MENKFPIFEETKLEKKEKKEVTWIYCLSVFIFFAVLAFVGFRFWVYFNFSFFPVRGTSMEPGINQGAPSGTVCDGVLVQKNCGFTYGDVVIVQPDGQDSTWIKRVIAMEGDKISIKKDATDGFYHVSLIYKDSDTIEVLQEDYINGYAEWTSGISETTYQNVQYEGNFYNQFIAKGKNLTKEADGAYYYQIQPGQFFFLGDNRQVSMDSRYVGTFRTSQVVAVARLVLPRAGMVKNQNQLWAIIFKGYVDYFWQVICDFFA